MSQSHTLLTHLSIPTTSCGSITTLRYFHLCSWQTEATFHITTRGLCHLNINLVLVHLNKTQALLFSRVSEDLYTRATTRLKCPLLMRIVKIWKIDCPKAYWTHSWTLFFLFWTLHELSSLSPDCQLCTEDFPCICNTQSLPPDDDFCALLWPPTARQRKT